MRSLNGKRRAREFKTINAMISLRAKRRPAEKDSGVDYKALLDYAAERLEQCRFKEGKPVCSKCPVHCYRPKERLEIRDVMREAGPEMLLFHPVLTIRHFWDALRSPDALRKGK